MATIGPPCVDAEAISMPARPIESLVSLRATIREAIADVWGIGQVLESAEGWRPHVSLAYSNASGPMRPITEALAHDRPQAVQVAVTAVSLIGLNRDNRSYEWNEVATVRLGTLSTA
jgi:hypothetical protein